MRSAVLVTLASLCLSAQTEIKLLRSQSGPSGRVVGSKFEFDSTKARFVYPQEKHFSVYFEWDAPPGVHALTAYWKELSGRTYSISPDVKLETSNRQLNCVWAFEIGPDMPAGVWEVEIRIDGRPAGSHPFELVVPERRTAPPQEPSKPPAPPSLDTIYRSAGASLVTIHRLDAQGHRIDSALGFVLGESAVATAFQCIDGASAADVEFANGSVQRVRELHGWSRVEDWALLKVPTGSAPALPRGDPATVEIGKRLIVFNIEANKARAIGGVDITGRRTLRAFGERLQLSPSPSMEAAGGPLLNEHGHVVGVVGGSITPGSRIDQRQMSVSPGVWRSLTIPAAAVPLSVLKPSAPTAWEQLAAQNAFTPRLEVLPEFSYGGSARTLTKSYEGVSTVDHSEFSRNDPTVWIYAIMQRRERRYKGQFSGEIYDPLNRLRVRVAPKKVSLAADKPTRLSFSFVPATLEPGMYRVDLLWDNKPFWRTWLTVAD